MGVAGEIGKHCFWPGEGRLGVDEPVLSLERREMRGEGLAPTQALDLAKKCQSAPRRGHRQALPGTAAGTGGKAVPQRVWRHALCDPRGLGGGADNAAELPGRQRLHRGGPWETTDSPAPN